MGSTYCYEWLFRYQDKISPGKLWDYITKDGTSKLLFDETTEKSYLYGLLISMVQTSTVRTLHSSKEIGKITLLFVMKKHFTMEHRGTSIHHLNITYDASPAPTCKQNDLIT